MIDCKVLLWTKEMFVKCIMFPEINELLLGIINTFKQKTSYQSYQSVFGHFTKASPYECNRKRFNQLI